MTGRTWLASAAVAEAIELARARATADAIAAALRYEARQDTPGHLVRIEGSDARVAITGVLTKKPDFLATFFGGGNVTYSAIRQAVTAAADDSKVSRIVLDIDSQGGSVDGLFETLDQLDAVRRRKSMLAVVENAHSAAYAIAAAAGRIEARGRGATVGSVGVATSQWVSEEAVIIVSTDSPEKRPDVRTDAGKAVVVKYLDQLNDVLVDAIARGRGVTARQVREGYGRGASFVAARALQLGMVDAVRGAVSGDAVPGTVGIPIGLPLPRSAAWPLRDMDAYTRLALEASEALDRRQAAERRARTEESSRPASPSHTPPLDPTRPWVRP